MPPRVSFEALPAADLTVGTVYEQGAAKTVAGEPLHRLMPGVGNQGGFRPSGSVGSGTVKYAVLYTSGEDTDWPDRLDEEAGHFTYFGDNKQPGSELHATSRHGNRLLRACFDALHGEPPNRHLIPPFFVFRKAVPGGNRDAVFIGLAVPGGRDIPPSSDLVAIWRTTAGQRFQNYRAMFTILDVGTVPRGWITSLQQGPSLAGVCPEPFRRFIDQGAYQALEAPRTIEYRTLADQQPTSDSDRALLQAIYDHFAPDPHAFEACAIELWKMATNEAVSFIEGTRRSADGGRDAVGLYSIGPGADRIHLDFSLEAKCYAPGDHAGVREVARLISRLRHRQFGVFVTTTALNRQAYRELRDDAHPVVVICGRDIADLLKEQGLGEPPTLQAWLGVNFPLAS